MIDMAKKQPPPEKPPEPAGRSGENLNVWVRSELLDALRTFLSSVQPRTTKTASVELALEEFLRERGFWPIKED